MLENQVRTQVLAMGFDPAIGYLHAPESGSPILIFDLMEPLRPIIDKKLLGFIKNHVFFPSDFLMTKMGICKLHPQFARNIIKLVQDLKEIELFTENNLKKLLALHPAAAKKAGKNIIAFKARLVGKRE
jgi:CRISPR/Cas system-associated endonuclease Cas1